MGMMAKCKYSQIEQKIESPLNRMFNIAWINIENKIKKKEINIMLNFKV